MSQLQVCSQFPMSMGTSNPGLQFQTVGRQLLPQIWDPNVDPEYYDAWNPRQKVSLSWGNLVSGHLLGADHKLQNVCMVQALTILALRLTKAG